MILPLSFLLFLVIIHLGAVVVKREREREREKKRGRGAREGARVSEGEEGRGGDAEGRGGRDRHRNSRRQLGSMREK